MVGGAPVAKAAKIDAGLVPVGDTGGSGGDIGRRGVDKGDQRPGFFLFAEKGAQQGHAVFERVVKDAARTRLQRDHRNAQLLLQGVFFFHVFVFGDHDVRGAGKDLFRFRRLGVGAAYAAGGQLGKDVAKGQNIGPCHGIEISGRFSSVGLSMSSTPHSSAVSPI